MKKYFLLVMLTWPLFVLQAQEELEPVDDATSSLSSLLGDGNRITAARVLSDQERKLSISIDYALKEDAEADFVLTGAILNKAKKPLKEVKSVQAELSKNGSSVDLVFNFKPQATYSQSYISSYYVSLTISKMEEGGLLSGLEEVFGGTDPFGDSFMYKFDKKWRVGGSESMEIQVKLTPFKTAQFIKP